MARQWLGHKEPAGFILILCFFPAFSSSWSLAFSKSAPVGSATLASDAVWGSESHEAEGKTLTHGEADSCQPASRRLCSGYTAQVAHFGITQSPCHTIFSLPACQMLLSLQGDTRELYSVCGLWSKTLRTFQGVSRENLECLLNLTLNISSPLRWSNFLPLLSFQPTVRPAAMPCKTLSPSFR